ncbi:hypothetical protein [Algoriphagus terrigena]|uniref:hypothetical protein n=1 Tax=Algoriphagus terrigena TaxID=344884 RepID=UPI0004042B70|nr:hypothetical protein [Algoriphagus terrigena]
MEKDLIQTLLAQFFGQLNAESAAEKKKVDEGMLQLARALPAQIGGTAFPEKLNLQTSDLFFQSKISSAQRIKLEQVIVEAEKEMKVVDDPGTRVFIRETPIKSSQIPGSVPTWAQGAKVDKTIGPIKRIDGVDVFLDVYKVVKLIALRKQGTNEPLILFKAQFSTSVIQKAGAPPIEVTDTYKVVAGSVWIKAGLLAANSPADRYVGLQVKSGEVKLSAKPTLQGENLILGAATTANVTLQLQEAKEVEVAKKKYGRDALAAKVVTPPTFVFSFGGPQLPKVTSVGNAFLTVYGQSSSLTFQANKNPTYSTQLNRVLIPMISNTQKFAPQKQVSTLHVLEESADLSQSWWGIPAAQLDVNAPLEVDGTGGIVQDLKVGLKSTWSGKDGNAMELGTVQLLVDPGRIGITALKGSSMDSFQKLDHWKDSLNPHGTSILLKYPEEAAFIYNSLAEGTELIMTQCHADVQVDRPKKVNGHAVDVRTKNSILLLAGTENGNIVYLIDDNILWDHKLPLDKAPKFKNIALALENALFTVSPVNGVVIFGKCNSEWTRIVESQTFLTFGLVSYLPTLPDPYLANFGFLGRLAKEGGNLDQIINWLFCRIIQTPLSEDEDKVSVSFHFGNPPAAQSTAPAESGKKSTAKIQESAAVTESLVGKKAGIRESVVFKGAKGLKESAVVKESAVIKESVAIKESVQIKESAEYKEAKIDTSTFSNKIADSILPEGPVGVLRTMSMVNRDVPNYEEDYNGRVAVIENDYFALLDVSSNANQVGVSFGQNPLGRVPGRETTGFARNVGENEAQIEPASGEIITVEGMEVKVPGQYARIFLMPQVAWEPTINTFEPVMPMDPPSGFNYYPNDGGPTRLMNTSPDKVTLAPIPLTDFLIKKFKEQKSDVFAQFTLPFGLKALAKLDHSAAYNSKPPKVEMNSPSFKDSLIGGIQIRAIGGDAGAIWPQEPHLNDSPMFEGMTTQLNNILDLFGNPTGGSTLGDSVVRIFNGEFGVTAPQPKGVPVSYIDFTGYGASTFSNWLSPSAAIAQTSQSRFDIMMGRTAHEVIQVKSLVYPWGIRVVRTITLFRTSSGFVYRMDSGWQPETDGQFDFRYKFKINGVTQPDQIPYDIHPGTLRGLFNIKNIKEDPSLADFSVTDTRKTNDVYIDVDGNQQTWLGANEPIPVFCRPVWFDADVELENLVQGHTKGRTPAKKILGYVQLAPSGVPLSPARFKELLNLQGGLIGGDIDCIMDLNKSGQQMRVTRFDFSHAGKPGALNPIFVASARGSVILPKTGSWSMVQHKVASGEVTQLPNHIPVPVIREGIWTPNFFKTPLDVPQILLRMASPSELLRPPGTATVNFGILQTTSTQKALILTPAFEKAKSKLLSKIPPLYADAYSLMSGNSIFPNAGNAIDEFGKAMPMLTGTGSGLNAAKAFAERSDIKDGLSNVYELLEVQVKKEGASIVDQGFKLLAGKSNDAIGKALAFDIPPFKTHLVDMEGLKIYIEYATTEKRKGQADKYVDSKLNFDIESLATDATKTWKSRMNNMAMVVDLGPIEGLMKIKGNFDAKKGSESGYKGDPDSDFPSLGYPTPDVEFHESLQPVIDLLEILASLGQGKYADVVKKGLEIAMSNAGEIWEYKFEAKKEIPLVRFPPEENLYNAPTTPLKLEAGLELGVFFNAALKVTTDPKQLLPTAGAYIEFRGGLEVLCASVGMGTIYAVGQVSLKLACDTKIGPSILMKFGFGISIAVGLPVVGTVSVTYIVGCELYFAMPDFSITAYMLFKGKASIAGGLVSVTIYIEASGSVARKNIGTAQERTECTASVTFGLDISICFIIDISFEETWQESRQIA